MKAEEIGRTLEALPPVKGNKTLIAKLAEVMKAVERVPKRGFNAHFGYAFATEADVADAIRQELADRSVMLIPRIVAHQFIELPPNKRGEPRDQLTLLDMLFTFWDGETGDNLACEWKGVGQDGGDKGIYKAMTGAEKYFLLKTFLMSTGDDPETSTEVVESAPVPPKTVVNVVTGEQVPSSKRPKPPDGYRYIDKYRIDGQWHHVEFLKYRLNGEGASFKTKFAEVGILAAEAYEQGVPVRVTVKEPATPGDEGFLQKVDVWKAPDDSSPF